MGCMRCDGDHDPSHERIDYPVEVDGAKVTHCRVCCVALHPLSAAAPDRDWQQRVDRAVDALVQRSLNDRTFAYWRDTLVAAGFEETSASLLAAAHGVDRHDALRLVQNGCPPALAFRILA